MAGLPGFPFISQRGIIVDASVLLYVYIVSEIKTLVLIDTIAGVEFRESLKML